MTEVDLMRLNGNRITHKNSSCMPPPTTAMHCVSVGFCHSRVKGWVMLLVQRKQI